MDLKDSSLLQVVERAKAEDLNRQVRYTVAFMRNRDGKIITDVSFSIVYFALSLSSIMISPVTACKCVCRKVCASEVFSCTLLY